jgi:hypothetical protein
MRANTTSYINFYEQMAAYVLCLSYDLTILKLSVCLLLILSLHCTEDGKKSHG